MSKGTDLVAGFYGRRADHSMLADLAARIDAALAEREHEPANYETCRCAGCDWWRGRVSEERARGIEEGVQALEAEARHALLHYPEDIFPSPSLAHGDEPRDLCTAAAVRHVVPVLVEGTRARAARIREGW